MLLSGTFANCIAIILGAAFGVAVGKKLKENYQTIAMQVLGLFTIVIGLQMSFKMTAILIVLLSLMLGALMGEWINIDGRIESFGKKIQDKFNMKESVFISSFMTTSLIFCTGSMAIMGSIEAGALSDSSLLYTKAMIDGTASIAFASTMGAGVILAALPVLIYQGFITLMASNLQPYFTPELISSLNGVGGLLVLAIGLNVTGITKLKVANMLPSILLVFFFSAII